jgi:hypothetical protein
MVAPSSHEFESVETKYMYKTISISDTSMRHSASEIAIEYDTKEMNNQANEVSSSHTKVETTRQWTRYISDAHI